MGTDASLASRRFRDLFEEYSRPLLGYALRRSASPADAADVLAETMLVAWRRLDDVPVGDGARLWLYGVARRVLANDRRGLLRRDRLTERLGASVERAVEAALDDAVVADVVLARAMARLDDNERDLLQLVSWEGLSPTEIAVVLNIPVATVRTRLHRARNKLRSMLQPADDLERRAGTGHVTAEGNIPLRPTEGRMR